MCLGTVLKLLVGEGGSVNEGVVEKGSEFYVLLIPGLYLMSSFPFVISFKKNINKKMG